MESPGSTDTEFKPLTGHCSCNAMSYSITALPLITHVCYCTWCQRESGSAFGLNVLVESYHFHYSSSAAPKDHEPLFVDGPTPSGHGQTVARCPLCFDGLFKYYGNNRHMTYVKAGTLDAESFNRVNTGERVHIYASTKPAWINLEEEREKSAGVFDEYYVREEVWNKDALERRTRLLKWIEAKKGR